MGRAGVGCTVGTRRCHWLGQCVVDQVEVRRAPRGQRRHTSSHSALGPPPPQAAACTRLPAACPPASPAPCRCRSQPCAGDHAGWPEGCRRCRRRRTAGGRRPAGRDHSLPLLLPPSVRLHRLSWALLGSAAPQPLRQARPCGVDPSCAGVLRDASVISRCQGRLRKLQCSSRRLGGQAAPSR